MIYTVTFNPSLDYIVNVKQLKLGTVNRTERELLFPGGKGINVSIVLNHLGVESTALGFIAGFTGEEIEKRVIQAGCKADFIPVETGWSRINLKIRSDEESEINGRGPEISGQALQRLYEKLELLKKDDILVLAGSIPNTLPDTIYSDILKRLASEKVKAVVDATGELLVNVLQFHPFLIKPNHHELAELFGKKLRDKSEIRDCALKLQDMGAGNVLVSMAGDGALLAAEDGTVYESPAPEGKVVNSVGAGDSMVAGFLAGYLEKQNYEDAFYMGIAAGSASAFSEQLAEKPEVQRVLKSLRGIGGKK